MGKFNSRNLRIVGFLGTVGASAALVGAAVVGTGAYFQDAKTDNYISGTMGSIQVTGHDGVGAHNLDIEFSKMLPGEANTKSVRFENTGANNQDVWVVFDATKLHALNQLGTYGEVHVSTGGSEVFGSANLNDGYPALQCGQDPSSTVCPVPSKIKLADNLAPGHTGDFTFSFTPGAKFQSPALMGAKLLDLPYTLVATQHGISPK